MKSRASQSRSKGVGRVPGGRRPTVVIAVLLAATAAASLSWLWWAKVRSAGSAPAAETLAERQVSFTVLTGTWQRPDGGYVLEVKSVDDRGVMDAAYFNPRSIRVARAQASRDNGALRVFVELRDENYPGATYRLTYQPQRDRLSGLYHQPLIGQTFEVYFERLQP